MSTKRIIPLFAIILVLFTLFSCQTKEERVLNKMERLAENIDNNAENFDDEDWEAVLNEFKALQEEALSCEFTHEQYIELGRVEGKLSSTLTSERAKSYGRDFKELLENGKNFINGFMDGINNE